MATQGRRRALGQHFLKDKTIANQIAETAVTAAIESGCKALLEIGPGKGAITLPLIELLKKTPLPFIVSERDPVLVQEWQFQKSAGAADPLEFNIQPGDFLELPEAQWLSQTPLAVASNLPYSAGTAIVVRLAKFHQKIPVMVLMFQAEVAKRLRAHSSTKEWGSLSVWIQNRWDVEKLVSVPPGAFIPPPQVDSEVVILRARKEPRIAVPEDAKSEAQWETLLKVCFAHRRKMLRSGLPPSGPWRNALELSGVDGTKRSEALSWDEWRRLYEALRSKE